MIRPDIIVLVIRFEESDKYRNQVNTKEFILGRPDKGETGDLERSVERELGSRLISCRDFSLIKVPISIQGIRSDNRARGAVGFFEFLGSTKDLSKTLQTVLRICEDAKKNDRYSKWGEIELLTAERWSS